MTKLVWEFNENALRFQTREKRIRILIPRYKIISSAIFNDAVAPGEGPLHTLMITLGEFCPLGQNNRQSFKRLRLFLPTGQGTRRISGNIAPSIFGDSVAFLIHDYQGWDATHLKFLLQLIGLVGAMG